MRGGITVHDLDHRPMFWQDESEAGHWARAALKHATVAVGNRDEVAVAVRTRDPYAASAALLDLGVEIAVVKRGPEGVIARTREELVEVEPVPVEVVNGSGPVTRSAARSSTACSTSGRWSARSGWPTRPGRS